MAPRTTVDANGVIEYTEIPRTGVSSLGEYTPEIVRSDAQFRKHPTPGPLQYHINSFQLSDLKHELYHSNPTKPRSLPGKADQIHSARRGQQTSSEYVEEPGVSSVSSSSEASRLVVLRGSTARDLSTLYKHAREGLGSIRSLTFCGKTALVTRYGGAGSIGAAAILQGSIDGGSCSDGLPRAISSPEVSQCYPSMYASRGEAGISNGVGVVQPGQRARCRGALSTISIVTAASNGISTMYCLSPQYPRNGDEIDGIDPKSESAHHLMLTNVLRPLGSIKKAKVVQRIQHSRPSQVILPLSLNDGTSGSDGLANKHKIVTASLNQRVPEVQVITNVQLAPERFPPIWRIVALTATSIGQDRSLCPRTGDQGILTTLPNTHHDS